MPTITSIQHYLLFLNQWNKSREKITYKWFRKEELKLLLLADNIIVSIENISISKLPKFRGVFSRTEIPSVVKISTPSPN